MARLKGFNKAQGSDEETPNQESVGQASFKTFSPPVVEDEAEKEPNISETDNSEQESRIVAEPRVFEADEPIQKSQGLSADIDKASNASVEVINKPEKDLSIKYTIEAEAIKSICVEGEYYEDIIRAADAGLTKSKEFVLCVLAQNPERFYCEQIPKLYEWVDEQYLTALTSRFFTETKESIKEGEVNDYAQALYQYLNKSGFSSTAIEVLNTVFKRVAKVHCATIISGEDALRMTESLKRFNEATSNALGIAKLKHENALSAAAAKRQALENKKLELVAQIDAMSL